MDSPCIQLSQASSPLALPPVQRNRGLPRPLVQALQLHDGAISLLWMFSFGIAPLHGGGDQDLRLWTFEPPLSRAPRAGVLKSQSLSPDVSIRCSPVCKLPRQSAGWPRRLRRTPCRGGGLRKWPTSLLHAPPSSPLSVGYRKSPMTTDSILLFDHSVLNPAVKN